MSKSGDKTLHIICGDYDIGIANVTVAYWSTFSDKENSISLPKMVEEQKELLKKEFFNFLNELSQLKIKGKTIIKTLQIEGGFSFWWPSLLNEKSIYKSPWIYDMFRVMLLRKIIVEGKYSAVSVHTSNTRLSKLFQYLARELNLEFLSKKYRKTNASVAFLGFRKIFLGMPTIVRAILFLCSFIWSNRLFIFNKNMTRKAAFKTSKKCISIVSYFPNIDVEKANIGKFHSNYWGDLPKKLMEEKFFICWTFIFAKSTTCSPRQAIDFINKFKESYPEQSFVFLHEYLNFKALFSSLKLYFKLCIRSVSVGKVFRTMRRVSELPTNYYLIKNDLLDSIIGKTAMQNCLSYALFERSTTSQKKSVACLYLMENQGWEKCLVYNWRTINQNPIIGYSHASIRYFDLRYFGFECEFKSGSNTLPTKFALCGGDSLAKMSEMDLPESFFLELEAVRYTYLTCFQGPIHSRESNDTQIRILCLTDIKKSSAVYQLEFLSDFVAKYGSELNISVVVKPHPFLLNAAALVKKYLSHINYTITTEHLNYLSNDVDIALVDSDTTAAIDVGYMHKPFASIKNPGEINLSPILKHGEFFIESIDDFYHKLCNIEGSKAYVNDVFHGNNEFFYLDENLPRWKNYLASI